MKLIPTAALLCAVLVSAAPAQNRRGAPARVSPKQIEAVVRAGFGPNVKVEFTPGGAPPYLLGDFNGDGFSDLAVSANVERAGADLNSYGVKLINIDPYSRQNGSQIDPISFAPHNCLGVAIIHGTQTGWASAKPAGKFMAYECFSSFRLIPKGMRIRRGRGSAGRTPVPKGDSILLDLETGGTALVYWDGKTYRGFGIRGGD